MFKRKSNNNKKKNMWLILFSSLFRQNRNLENTSSNEGCWCLLSALISHCGRQKTSSVTGRCFSNPLKILWIHYITLFLYFSKRKCHYIETLLQCMQMIIASINVFVQPVQRLRDSLVKINTICFKLLPNNIVYQVLPNQTFAV